MNIIKLDNNDISYISGGVFFFGDNPCEIGKTIGSLTGITLASVYNTMYRYTPPHQEDIRMIMNIATMFASQFIFGNIGSFTGYYIYDKCEFKSANNDS